MATNIKVLDCTLRDGGYINDWNFGIRAIQSILNNLVKANLDYIECGYLKDLTYDTNKTFFPNIEELNSILPQGVSAKFCMMINYGEYDINKVPSANKESIILRVAFKKSQYQEAAKYCEALKNKGYDVFMNPMNTSSYSARELLDLIEMVNDFRPKVLTIVDSFGSMKESDVLRMFYLMDSTLRTDIAIGFHSHNSLQLSFSNAQAVIINNTGRNLIIDSSIFGMGRGAGNLCTELIIQYMNDHQNGRYNLVPVLKSIDEDINPIYISKPWGYSVPYYLAATNKCHPNYATYLTDKHTVSVEEINKIIGNLPNEDKAFFNKDLIKKVYIDAISDNVDDEQVFSALNELINNRPILILAPGKTLETEKNKVDELIESIKPCVISLNFVPGKYSPDMAFVNSVTRLDQIGHTSCKLLVTSNIKQVPTGATVVNYSSYLNDSDLFDNVALMFFRLLIKLGIKTAYIAGFDGLSIIPSQNYVSTDLVHNINADRINSNNKIISDELQNIGNSLKLVFVTKSIYTN